MLSIKSKAGTFGERWECILLSQETRSQSKTMPQVCRDLLCIWEAMGAIQGAPFKENLHMPILIGSPWKYYQFKVTLDL